MIPDPEVSVCGSRAAVRNPNWVGFIVTFLRCNYLISSQPGDVYCKLHILTLKVIRIAAVTSCFIVRQQSICGSLPLLVPFGSLPFPRHGWVSRLSFPRRCTLMWDEAASHRPRRQTGCLCVKHSSALCSFCCRRSAWDTVYISGLRNVGCTCDIVFVGVAAMTSDL